MQILEKLGQDKDMDISEVGRLVRNATLPLLLLHWGHILQHWALPAMWDISMFQYAQSLKFNLAVDRSHAPKSHCKT